MESFSSSELLSQVVGVQLPEGQTYTKINIHRTNEEEAKTSARSGFKNDIGSSTYPLMIDRQQLRLHVLVLDKLYWKLHIP